MITPPKDLRLGQAIFNFMCWLASESKIKKQMSCSMLDDKKKPDGHFIMADPFYVPDEQFNALWDEWSRSIEEKANG